jgi:predicted membrane channel-forming protein YqfA (hemolysin III family)
VYIHNFIFCLLFFSSKANSGYRASIKFVFHEELHGVSFLCRVLYHSFPRLSMLCMHKMICPDHVVVYVFVLLGISPASDCNLPTWWC